MDSDALDTPPSRPILLERAGRSDLLRVRRRQHERMTFGTTAILIRDQAPLYSGNLALTSGFSFGDLVESMNRRVFFWPGTATGPVSYGVRHFERYREERPVLLRIDYESLLRANSAADPLYCKYNSGAPRCSFGMKSPRGPRTYSSANSFDGTPSKVVEVTFVCELKLPSNTEFGGQPTGPWSLLL
jgi:hypothetical protein